MELRGAQMQMGLKLHSTFVAAGLPEPSMKVYSVLGGGKNAAQRVRMLVDLLRTLSDAATRLGVATASEIGLETLEKRMREEAITRASLLVGNGEIGAWTRV